MSLNIKNPRVHALAREVARRAGLTQTAAIEKALELMLAEIDDHSAAVDELIAGLQDDIAAHGTLSESDLYDDAGLPT